MSPRISSIDELGLRAILANYELGALSAFRCFENGDGQTTLLLKTSQREVVLRLYENRSIAHVNFEVQLIDFLLARSYPVPAVLEGRAGERVGIHRGKPYLLLELVDGEHCQNPNEGADREALSAIIRAVANLHNLTAGVALPFASERAPFDQTYCWQQFQQKHDPVLGPSESLRYRTMLDALEFPKGLPLGICHADLNHGNFLLSGGEVKAVLDFDMSFYGHLIYDVASLIYWWAMPPDAPFRADTARFIVSEYREHRMLLDVEAAHIMDALKLIILLGAAWGEHSDVWAEIDRVDQLSALSLDFRE